jgi:hypothetical protein
MPALASASALPMPRNSLYHQVGARQTLLVEPARSYVICCVQRTGSWLLAHTLADTGYAGRPRRPGYASRRLSTQNVTASRAAASTTKMPVSMPWKAQNLLAGW